MSSGSGGRIASSLPNCCFHADRQATGERPENAEVERPTICQWYSKNAVQLFDHAEFP